jgi:hypothetical protein
LGLAGSWATRYQSTRGDPGWQHVKGERYDQRTWSPFRMVPAAAPERQAGGYGGAMSTLAGLQGRDDDAFWLVGIRGWHVNEHTYSIREDRPCGWCSIEWSWHPIHHGIQGAALSMAIIPSSFFLSTSPPPRAIDVSGKSCEICYPVRSALTVQRPLP